MYFVYARQEGFFGKSGDVYMTFDGKQKLYPSQTIYPNTLQEISQAITDNPGQTIKATGNECVYNDIFGTDIMFRMDNLNKIIKLDTDTKEITVEAGCTIESICKYLEEHNLALGVIPDNLEQTIGSACQLAEHGSNINTGTFSDQVLAMTLVLSNGHVRRIELDDPEFPAFVTGLGIFGVVYSLTLKCVDLYYISIDKKIGKWNKLKNEGIIDCSRIYINPQTLQTTIHVNKIDTEGVVYYRALPRRVNPNTFTKCEIAVSADKATDAIGDLLKLLSSHKKISGLNVENDISITFSGGDYNSWLSPASGRPVAWIAVNVSPDKQGLDKFFQDLQDLMLYKYSGRPSWTTIRDGTPYKMRLLYGVSIDYIRKTQRQFDPTLRCSNKFVENIL